MSSRKSGDLIQWCVACVCMRTSACACGCEGAGVSGRSYRMMQGFLSLKGFSEVGTPTSRGSLRACCSQ